jgi:RNA polymerase sigma-70 factor (ECF subfamily)
MASRELSPSGDHSRRGASTGRHCAANAGARTDKYQVRPGQRNSGREDEDGDMGLDHDSIVDPSRFEPLVDAHGPALHAYLVRRAPSAADDLLAEVWLAAFQARGTFDPGLGSVRGWLFGVARNVVSAHRRRDRARAPATPAPDDDGWEAVDARLDAAALAPAMRAALADLPAIERELLLLIAWEQLTPAEAAQAVGIPAVTARTRLHRARTRMRAHVALTTEGSAP